MKYSLAIMTASLAVVVLTHPLDNRTSQHCNVAPFAAKNDKIKPISQPSTATAEACLKACRSRSDCESFVFGLDESAKSPTCKLFKVPASELPSQGSQLHAFDKACAKKDVPDTKPTHSAPRGTISHKSQRDLGNQQDPHQPKPKPEQPKPHQPKPKPQQPKAPKQPDNQYQPRGLGDHQDPHQPKPKPQQPKPQQPKAPKQPDSQYGPRDLNDQQDPQHPEQHQKPKPKPKQPQFDHPKYPTQPYGQH